MSHPWLFRLAGRVKGIAQANQAIGTQLVSQQAGHAPTHGLTADHQRPRDCLSHLLVHQPPLLQQLGLRIGWTTSPASPPQRHVSELKAQHRNPTRSKAFSHLLHKQAVHRCTRPVRQDQAA